MFLDNGQRRLAAFRLKNVITTRPEGARGESAHRILVLDKQDRTLAREVGGIRRGFGGLGLGLRLCFRRRFEIARQIDTEGRSLADRGVREDETAGLLHDAINGRKPQPRSLARVLGRIEGLENLPEVFLGNTAASIRHLDQQIFAGRHQRMIERAGIFFRHIGRADRELAAVRHGVARIDSQVHDDLLKLVLVNLDEPQIAAMHDLEFNLFGQQPRQKILQLGQSIGQRKNLGPQRLAA